MRVLIADDNEALRLLLCVALYPHRGIPAKDGAEAIELAQRHQPDVVLMEVMMPEMDGFEALRRLKENEATASIPVVLMSAGMVRQRDVGRGMSLGAEAYWKKPFTMIGLGKVLEGLVAKKSPGRDPDSPTTGPNLHHKIERSDMMLQQIIPQVEEEVKCSLEDCDEDVFRGGLCFDHFIEEELAAWNAWADEMEQAHLVSVGRG